MKQWHMAKLFKDDSHIRFFIGDVRDKDRLCRALGVILCSVCCTNKVFSTAEYDPFECVQTGALNSLIKTEQIKVYK